MAYLHLFCLGLCLALTVAAPLDNDAAKLRKLAADPEFRQLVEKIVALKRQETRKTDTAAETPEEPAVELQTRGDDTEGSDEAVEQKDIAPADVPDAQETLIFLGMCDIDRRLTYIEEFLKTLRKKKDRAKRGSGEDVIEYLKLFPSVGEVCDTVFAGIKAGKEPKEIEEDVAELFPERRLQRVQETVGYNFFVLCDQNERLMDLENVTQCLANRRQLRAKQVKRSIPELSIICNIIRDGIYAGKDGEEIMEDVVSYTGEQPEFKDPITALQVAQGWNFFGGCVLLHDLLTCTGEQEEQPPFGLPRPGTVCLTVFQGFEDQLSPEEIEMQVVALFPQGGTPQDEKNALEKLEESVEWNFWMNCNHEAQLKKAEEEEGIGYDSIFSRFLPWAPANSVVCKVVIQGIEEHKSAEEIEEDIANVYVQWRLQRVQETVEYNFFVLCDQNERLMDLENETQCLANRRQLRAKQEKRSIPELSMICNIIRDGIYAEKTRAEIIEDVVSYTGHAPEYEDPVTALQVSQGWNFYLGCVLLHDLLTCTGEEEEEPPFGLPRPGTVCVTVFEGFENGKSPEQIESEVVALFPEGDIPQHQKSKVRKLEESTEWNFWMNCNHETQLEEAEEDNGIEYDSIYSRFLPWAPANSVICEIVRQGIEDHKTAEQIEQDIASVYMEAMEKRSINNADTNYIGNMKRELALLLSELH